MANEIAFAAIVASADIMDDMNDPSTWKVMTVTGKNLDTLGGVNSVSGYYQPRYSWSAVESQFVTRKAESVMSVYHTLQSAQDALDRAERCYGEYRGRIAAAERNLRELQVSRSEYVQSAIKTDGLSLLQAVEKI